MVHISNVDLRGVELNSAPLNGVTLGCSANNSPSEKLPTEGLVGLWSFNKSNEDADRDVVRDLSGNGCDFRLYDFDWNESSGYNSDGGLAFDGVKSYMQADVGTLGTLLTIVLRADFTMVNTWTQSGFMKKDTLRASIISENQITLGSVCAAGNRITYSPPLRAITSRGVYAEEGYIDMCTGNVTRKELDNFFIYGKGVLNNVVSFKGGVLYNLALYKTILSEDNINTVHNFFQSHER